MAERRFAVRVLGDGPERELREGGKRDTLAGSFRYCAPAAQAEERKAERPFALAACASRYDTQRSCLNIEGSRGEYLNEMGERYLLEVASPTAKVSGDALDGSLSAVARHAGRKLDLRIEFHAGTRVAAVPEGDSPFFHQRGLGP